MSNSDQEELKKIEVNIRLDIPESLHEQCLAEEEFYKTPFGVILSGFLIQADIACKEAGVKFDLHKNINWMQVSDAAPWLLQGDE